MMDSTPSARTATTPTTIARRPNRARPIRRPKRVPQSKVHRGRVRTSPARLRASPTLRKRIIASGGSARSGSEEKVYVGTAALGCPQGLRQFARVFHVLAHVFCHVRFFFVFHGDESREILPVQFPHDLGNFRNPFSEQHVHFTVDSLNVLEVYEFQAWTQFAESVYRIMSAGSEVSHIRGGADGFGKPVERVQHVFG